MLTSVVVTLALAASALANVYMTSPNGTTTWTGGENCTVSWIEDNKKPLLPDFGPATFGIYTGNANSQILLQVITPNVNVSAMSLFSFVVDPTIGPDSDQYFLRCTSLALKNPNTPQYPALAFSAKFTLTKMTGSFNSSVQAAINGQSTAPIGGSSTANSPSATGISAGTTPAITGASAATTSTTSTNGASKPILATGLVGLIATLVGASLL